MQGGVSAKVKRSLLTWKTSVARLAFPNGVIPSPRHFTAAVSIEGARKGFHLTISASGGHRETRSTDVILLWSCGKGAEWLRLYESNSEATKDTSNTQNNTPGISTFAWTAREPSQGAMMRSKPASSMQKTYDECYLICSTAVYFEGQACTSTLLAPKQYH